jgi:hypothetical protein
MFVFSPFFYFFHVNFFLAALLTICLLPYLPLCSFPVKSLKQLGVLAPAPKIGV